MPAVPTTCTSRTGSATSIPCAPETTRGIQAYQRSRATLTPAQRQDTETRLRILRQQYMDYQNAIQTKDGEEQQHLTQQVLDSSNAFLRRYGARNNYDMILLTAEGDNLAYANRGFDVTVPVLQEINAKYAREKVVNRP